ncbi:MAG: CPBP family intramembrane metalloprotease [Kocuria sp.]|nr:CPBP family intramembrane metalloprotease [Kocuria sp.]
MNLAQTRKHRAHLTRRRRTIRVLRTLWTPVRLTTPGSIPRSTAWTLVGGLYSIQWLTATITAFLLALFPPATPTGTRDAWTIFNSLVPAAALTIAGIGVLQLLAKVSNTPPHTVGASLSGKPARWQASVGVFLLAMLIFQARGFITPVLEAIPGAPPERSFPWVPPSDPAAAAFLIYDSMISGAVEEVIVLAVPVVALRAAGVRWRIILPTVVLLRTAFHVYYGPIAMPAHLIWALSLALLYIATGRIWPLFLAHVVNNGVASLYYVLHQKNPAAASTFANATQATLLACAGLGLALACLLCSGLRTARQHARP